MFAVKDWCSSRRLQLNVDKTELIWFGSRANLKRLSHVDTCLKLESNTIMPSATVRDLGVYLDNELNMRAHIGKVSSICFMHLRRLRQLRCNLTRSCMQRLVFCPHPIAYRLLQFRAGRTAGHYTSSVTASHACCSLPCSESGF